MKKMKSNLLPFDVIQAAASGNSEALDKVLRYYSGYKESTKHTVV